MSPQAAQGRSRIDELWLETPSESSIWSPAADRADTTPSSWDVDVERRRHPRVPLALRGRYMIEDGSEFRCQTVDVSPVGIAIRGFLAGAVGRPIVAYLDDLGRIEGVIVRRTSFLLAIDASPSPRKIDRLAAKIDSLVQRRKDGFSGQIG